MNGTTHNCNECGKPLRIGAVVSRTRLGLARCAPSDEGAVHLDCASVQARREQALARTALAAPAAHTG